MQSAAAGAYGPSREIVHAGHELTQVVLPSKTSRKIIAAEIDSVA